MRFERDYLHVNRSRVAQEIAAGGCTSINLSFFQVVSYITDDILQDKIF